jgi:ribonuclease HI
MKGPRENQIVLFCDGACTGNPGPGGWGAVIATPAGQIRELGNYALNTTNNKMELLGAIEGLRSLGDAAGDVGVYTDSSYVIRGITQWIWGWRKRGWQTAEGGEVANKDMWQLLSEQVVKREKHGKVEWHYVRGHSGIPGNERCDEIAVSFAKTRRAKLYQGPLMGYDVALYDIPADTSVPEMRPKNEKKPAAHSYLSLVDGELMRHATWAECERRVKGRSGAKFKKAQSESDETAIKKAWGVDGD